MITLGSHPFEKIILRRQDSRARAMKMWVLVLVWAALVLGCARGETECADECTCTKRKASSAAKFRSNQGYVFYQHIHKAGGSTLCSILARSRNVRLGANVNCNLERQMIPGNKSSTVQMRSLPVSWSLKDVERMMDQTGRNVLAAEDQPFSRMWGLSDTPMSASMSGVDNSKWSFVTILRHPVERILSHYKFEELHKLTQRSVVDWAKWSPFQGQNYMVRMFAGLVPPLLPRHYLEEVDTIWPYFDHTPPAGWDAASVPAVTRADLEVAKRVLQRFTVVLTLDWMGECTPLLSRWLGIETEDIRARYWWGSIQATPKHKRKHPQRGGEFSELFALNELDMELYEFAKGLCRCNGQKLYWRDHDEDRNDDSSCLRAHKGASEELVARQNKDC